MQGAIVWHKGEVRTFIGDNMYLSVQNIYTANLAFTIYDIQEKKK